MDKRIQHHFRTVDPILFAVLTKLDRQAHELVPRKTTDYFSDLCEAIVNQQLSEKAGLTIFNRFLDLLSGRKPTPKAVDALNDKKLRAVGVSWSKVRFIKGLAKSFLAKEIDFSILETLPDEVVITELVKLHGIGPWTAEMFLMFSLGRPDVFSHGDLGLRRAIQKLYKFKKEPTRKQVEKIIAKWAPYKTYACRILWRSLELSP